MDTPHKFAPFFKDPADCAQHQDPNIEVEIQRTPSGFWGEVRIICFNQQVARCEFYGQTVTALRQLAANFANAMARTQMVEVPGPSR